MRYLRAYQYTFDSPKWATNILVAIVCQLVPIVGQMVLFGYLFEVIEKLHRQGRDTPYPDFSMDRLMPYLIRGAWVFLAQFLLGMIMFPLIVGFYIVFFAMFPPGRGQPPDMELMIYLIGGFMAAMFILQLLLSLVMTPVMLRIGLTQDFKAGFSWAFISDFIGRMWGMQLLVALYLGVTGFLLVIAGMLLCFIGVYPAAALMVFAQFYMLYQLYELYLQRGGTPIPIKEEPAPVHPGEDQYEGEEAEPAG